MRYGFVLLKILSRVTLRRSELCSLALLSSRAGSAHTSWCNGTVANRERLTSVCGLLSD